MKLLCSFYCLDCDNAFLNIMEDADVIEEKCDYCQKVLTCEEVIE